ncbi:polysaccharide deacetylase [Chitinivorax sp. B]|uniref:polysaccharide deacetylase family protein n=1 Tax=Chitinivorax sp. B TaxID=2502235 RepID=UPI0010FA3B96|nr:polysaccharide deacetylase [Chitinivorax sp. B]
MLDAFFTIDVEIWCNGWNNLQEKFPSAYRKYIHGSTAAGNYGLPYQLKVLNDYNLAGVFFIEPLFSACFGTQPLTEIVGMVEAARQEVQLHLHTEWVDEACSPLLPNVIGKRQHMRYFSREEQALLIKVGTDMLHDAGAHGVNAFRAGSFGMNSDTLLALADNRFKFDTSYNASLLGPDSGVMPGQLMTEPAQFGSVHEYPIMVFKDGINSLRHVQLTACSFDEIEGLMWQALEQHRTSFVILSHGFELLNMAKDRADPIAVKRFHKLCAFLDRNRDCFRTVGFKNLIPQHIEHQPEPLASPLYRTGLRMMQQAYRRAYQ